MNAVALVLGFGLGAGFLAIVHEVCRWDASRRLAAGLVAGDKAAAAAPAARGRHRSDDTLDIAGNAFRAGLAARDAGPVSTDPADHAWQRPSTMIPAEFTARHPGSSDHRTLAEQVRDLAAAPYIPAPTMLPEIAALPVARVRRDDVPVWAGSWDPQEVPA